jgi:hypothetical protein
MTRITRMVAPVIGDGKDPNDARDDPGFKERVENSTSDQTLSWAEAYVLTDQEAAAISEPEWIIENLVIRGHVIVIVAAPNGGKTTIFVHLAGEMTKAGNRVFYVNADISGGDAKAMVEHAKANGYTLLLPDMKAGLSMDDVVARLVEMNEVGGDFGEVVFIFDTLKKMTDVINKSKAKELYKVLRGLSSKGMTIVLLAHTNKYDGPDGRPIFEGTGDLRADVDELIYLIPRKSPDGSMTVSTEPDKVRGKFQRITFHVSPEREVSQGHDFVDVIGLERARNQLEKDHTTIEAITEAIKSGHTQHVEIIDHCREHHQIGRRTVERVLIRYRNPPKRLWRREKGFQNNVWYYHLEETEQCSP